MVSFSHVGLINTHVHTSQQLARGIADDVDLLTWLHERIWPYEANMTAEDSYISTLLCGIELIHSGVHSFIFLHDLSMSTSHKCVLFVIAVTVWTESSLAWILSLISMKKMRNF